MTLKEKLYGSKRNRRSGQQAVKSADTHDFHIHNEPDGQLDTPVEAISFGEPAPFNSITIPGLTI